MLRPCCLGNADHLASDPEQIQIAATHRCNSIHKFVLRRKRPGAEVAHSMGKAHRRGAQIKCIDQNKSAALLQFLCRVGHDAVANGADKSVGSGGSRRQKKRQSEDGHEA
jgi:hypothetical protein